MSNVLPGWNSIESSREVTCSDCFWTGELDGSTWMTKYDWSSECPNCKNIIDVDLYEDPMFAD